MCKKTLSIQQATAVCSTEIANEEYTVASVATSARYECSNIIVVSNKDLAMTLVMPGPLRREGPLRGATSTEVGGATVRAGH
jgi:hypothetical protein